MSSRRDNPHHLFALALRRPGISATARALGGSKQAIGRIGLSFDYGQRHRQELVAAGDRPVAADPWACRKATSPWRDGIWRGLGGSALTGSRHRLPKSGVGGRHDSTHLRALPQHGCSFALGLRPGLKARGGPAGWCSAQCHRFIRLPDCRPDYLAAFQHSGRSARQERPRGPGHQALGHPGGSWDKARIVSRGAPAAGLTRLRPPGAATPAAAEPCGPL